MRVRIKLAKAFEKYGTALDNEGIVLEFEKPVTVQLALDELKIPGSLPKLILINGRVTNQEKMLQDGDTLSIFPTMSGG